MKVTTLCSLGTIPATRIERNDGREELLKAAKNTRQCILNETQKFEFNFCRYTLCTKNPKKNQNYYFDLEKKLMYTLH